MPNFDDQASEYKCKVNGLRVRVCVFVRVRVYLCVCVCVCVCAVKGFESELIF